MMIRMRVTSSSALRIPPTRSSPLFPSVSRQMQINAATQHVVGTFRMNGDRVSVGNLTFRPEMTTADFFPFFTSISAAEDAEQHIAAATQSALGESIDYIRI